MPSEILCNSTGKETRVALMENGRLAELQIDRGDNRGFVGNIYLGRVVRVLPGMQAAFVDIGLERAAFLYVGDITPDVLQLTRDDDENDPDDSALRKRQQKGGPRATTRAGQPPIQDLIQEGQEIVVQVAKDPIGTKGARLTTHVAMPGRFLVFMPTVDHIGISRRIDRDRERKRLRDIVSKNRRKGAGYIVRTTCQGRPNAVLQQDMEFLEKSWEKVLEKQKTAKAPSCLHQEYGIVLRAVRDLFHGDIKRMVVDDKAVSDRVQSFMDDFMPDAKKLVHLYRGQEPIFDTYGVEVEIGRSLGRKVWLKSGGYLVIDQTEALMAIDVNSGKFVGSSSLEDTTLRINLEAVHEVACQLRLRNIGGIIVIDFIDMDREQNREKVYKALDDALRKDRARTNVLKISDLGLVQMTRKRVQEGLDRYLMEDCPTCGGIGHVRSRGTLCFEILREVRREAHRSNAETIYINTTPEIADMLYSDQFDDLTRVEEQVARKIVVRAMPAFHPEHFEVYAR